MTEVIKCVCKHTYQDRLYGEGKRLHNKGDKDGMWRCTVCGKENRK